MTNFKFIFVLIGILFFANSCKKVDVSPQLEVYIINSNSEPVTSVTVKLYKNQDDWENNTNIIAQGVTDISGKVLFESLDETDYYIRAQKDNLNNNYTDVKLVDNLKKNYRIKVTIMIK